MSNLYSVAQLLRFEQCYTRGPSEECWLWNRPLDNGYGRFWVNGRTDDAHRIAYQIAYGPIALGLHINHVKTRGCTSRACVNPAHLEPVTIVETVLRGDGISAKNARKTHCLRGHPFSGYNLYVTPRGHRQCRTCHLDRLRAWRMRNSQSPRRASARSAAPPDEVEDP